MIERSANYLYKAWLKRLLVWVSAKISLGGRCVHFLFFDVVLFVKGFAKKKYERLNFASTEHFCVVHFYIATSELFVWGNR